MAVKIMEYLFWKRTIKKIERCAEPADVKRCMMRVNLKEAPHWFIKRTMRKTNHFIDSSELTTLNLDLAYEIYKRAKDDVIRGVS